MHTKVKNISIVILKTKNSVKNELYVLIDFLGLTSPKAMLLKKIRTLKQRTLFFDKVLLWMIIFS
ncbi:hypothetical protein BTO16_07940 [Polaribacter glomeratus]|uniref:Uncharacterized protein n=1 Tax=Polaribacter glomeratus TaxID=102 RepID=A0A2S7WYL4_9FLAO|nr:hypothetical protein BTO16_07940 [Polaribacter glomeratus]